MWVLPLVLVGLGVGLILSSKLLIPFIVVLVLWIMAWPGKLFSADRHLDLKVEKNELEESYEGCFLIAEDKVKFLRTVREGLITQYDHFEKELVRRYGANSDVKAGLLKRCRGRQLSMLERLGTIEKRYHRLMKQMHLALQDDSLIDESQFQLYQTQFDELKDVECGMIEEYDDLILELEAREEVENI